jgi:hypothetical protein
MFLIQGLVFGGLATLTHDPDWQSMFEARSYSGWILFDNPHMLPEEMLTPMLWFVKTLIVALPILTVWFWIIKPLCFGG